MKTFILRFLKYAFLVIAGLVVACVAGLLIYYHSIYQETPLPKEETSIQTVAQPSRLSGIVLLPVPKKINWMKGSFTLGRPTVQSAADHESLIKLCSEQLSAYAAASGSTPIQFTKNPALQPQAYRLKILQGTIKIEYSELRGAFYALTTLRQIARQAAPLPCVEIEDQPDLNIRAALIDVSRGKVPTLQTLYELVDALSDLKYNQLQLYVEGFSFGYPSFKRFWEKTDTPLLPEEIRMLDQYCRDRFIELVPNQNSLGHMQDWLKQEELKNLAECPEGYKLLGLIEMKTTLSPTDPRSLELVKQMSEDLLPNFSSRQFNVNLDEPFELGKSKQRPISDQKEIARLYLDYAMKLHAYVKSKDRTMMMWGDVVSRTPEIITSIPKDIMLLEWRYEAIQSFDPICQKYQQAGLRYMVCPGTSSWSSFTGRTENMLNNIANAAASGVKFGADGLLVTDWGDTPHLQYLTVSYPGFAWAGALSWNYASKDQVSVDRYLSDMVFQDKSHRMGSLVMDLGRYNQFEEYPMMAMTTTNFASRLGMMDPVMFNAVKHKLQQGILELGALDTASSMAIRKVFDNPKPYESKKILAYLSALDAVLDSIRLEGKEGPLMLAEYKNAIRMTKAAALLKHYILFHLQQSDDENRASLQMMKALCTEIIAEHERLWMLRNKRSGLKGSLEGFEKLRDDASAQLELLDANAITRWGARTGEQLKSAAAALFLR